MRRITFMILGLAFAPAARAGDWSNTYTLGGKPDLRVETSDASIRLDTPSNIRGKLNGGGKALTIHTGDGSIRLQKS